MDNIYFNTVLTKKLLIQSKHLDENIDEYINTVLKKKIEGKCVDEGYIKPDTTKIIKKGVGMLLGSRFTGDITYNIAYTAEICNPVVGNIIDCKVRFVNKLGLLGNNGPITIIVGKQFHDAEEEINNIKEGDIVKVEVIAKKFSLNDTEIKIIAKLWSENEKKEKKVIKKDIISSDLTPIEFDKVQENEMPNFEEEESEDEMDEDEMEEEEEEMEEDEEENNEDVQFKNPEDNLEADDIELDDFSEDDEEDEEDDEY
jgi:DNA-directed RNA polymerase subunit E'/Rpb7